MNCFSRTAGTSLPASPRRESPVTIAAIDGRTVTLSKPLDFESNT